MASLEDFLNTRRWKPKTRNDFLTSVSALFKYAQHRNWTRPDHNPAQKVARRKEVRGPIHVFEPWELKQMLNRLAARVPDLVPFLALWAFAGIRKDEIGRMSWQQVNRGLVTGHIELLPGQTKTGEGRMVPVTNNLKAWLTAYRKELGPIVPPRWLAPTKSSPNRLKEITRFIARKTAIVWKENAPRHSFGTYYFKVCKDPGEVTAAMGTSLQKFQRYYWNKAKSITEEAAKEWFGIVPDQAEKVVSLSSCAEPSDDVAAPSSIQNQKNAAGG